MEVLRYHVYGVINNSVIDWRITSSIDIDLAYWYHNGYFKCLFITSKLSIGLAEEIRKCIEGKIKIDNSIQDDDEKLSGIIRKTLSKCQLNQERYIHIHWKDTSAAKNNFDMYLNQYVTWMMSIYQLLLGKILLLSELSKYIPKYVEMQNDINNYIQTGYLLEDIKITSGVTYPSVKTNEQTCNRCGSERKIIHQTCYLCKEDCATCEECISFGRSKTCTPLFIFRFEKYHQNSSAQMKASQISNPLLNLQLSEFQQKIAKKAVNFINDKNKKSLLIWAVTGAGKTEMIFPTIMLGLNKNQRILLASPRKDVIKELTPRFQKAFSDRSIVSLFGGSKQKLDYGDIYLATTHQVIRFYDFFDLVIIDEIDAFPFHNNRLLHNIVQRSIKKDGKLIYLTATPPIDVIEKNRKKNGEILILPIRHHLHPLPIPFIELIQKRNKLLSKNIPPQLFIQFFEMVREREGQALIFVPGVKDIPLWTSKLKSWFSVSIEGVFASDIKRDPKIELFRAGKIKFLVTTTILERGITIENVHVLVLGAEAKIFDESTLIQISGRVGRSINAPNGLVWFLAETITSDMLKAKKYIKRMNKLASKLKIQV